MTTTDPADVHTGTGRVELTDAQMVEAFPKMRDAFKREHEWRKNAESERDAARAELTAANAQLRAREDDVDRLIDERDAANARCAELEALVDGMHREVDRIGAENLRHLATLDRVTALAPKWEQHPLPANRVGTWTVGECYANDLRAALTPEGTE